MHTFVNIHRPFPEPAEQTQLLDELQYPSHSVAPRLEEIVSVRRSPFAAITTQRSTCDRMRFSLVLHAVFLRNITERGIRGT